MRQEDCFCYKILIDEYISGHIAMNNIKLNSLEDRDREQFILDNQEAFNYGALEEFGRRDDHFEEDEQIISRETIEKSIDNGEVKSSKVIDTGETGHGALAGFLQEAGANVMICGGIGGGTINAMAESGIKIYAGASGIADEVVKSYLEGTLAEVGEATCDHHDHEYHGDHKCGHGECHH